MGVKKSVRVAFIFVALIVVAVLAANWLRFKMARRWRPTWPNVSYTEVRGYSYNPKGEMSRHILTNDKLDDTVLNGEGTLLSQSQVERLVTAVSDYDTSMIESGSCFNPRHAFIFYGADSKPVAWVEVCFECTSFTCDPSPSGPCDIPALAAICYELKLPNNPGPDYTWPSKRKR